MLAMAVDRSSFSRVTKSQGERGNFGVFFQFDNALYSITFGAHTKTAELIEMPFGMISELGPRNSVLRGGDNHERERGNFGEKICKTSLTPVIIANWTGPCSNLPT